MENGSQTRLDEFGKAESVGDARTAIDVLRKNDVLSQSMIVIGSHQDTRRSMEDTREFARSLDSDITIFSVLTPLPGSNLYE